MRRSAMTACVLAGVLGLASSARAQSRALPRVAVVIATEVNVGSEHARELGDELAIGLEKALQVDAVGGSYVASRVPPDLAPDCAGRRECVRDLGHRLQVEEILFLVMTRVGNRIEIEPVWIEVEGELEAVSRESLEVAADGSAWDEAFLAAAPGLLPHAGRRETRPRVGPRPSRLELVGAAMDAERDEGTRRDLGAGFWTSAGIGAAGLLGGTAVAVLARRDYDALEADGCDQRVCDQERVDRLARRAVAADVLFAVGAVASLTAVALYATADEEKPRIGISASGDGAAVWIGGSL